MSTHDLHGRESPRLQPLHDRGSGELELLKKDRFSWPLAIGFAVAVLAVVGLLAYLSRSRDSLPTGADRPPAESTQAPAALPLPLTPLERATEWQKETLAGTPFANLRIQPVKGRHFLVYLAAPGDSIRSIVDRYLESARSAPADRGEVLRRAEATHRLRYHRVLWPDDEVYLLLDPPGL
jgi:hypothetical protein